MNQHPVVLLDPVFKWLDHLVRDYGLYIYMVCVWLSPLLIAWILSGAFGGGHAAGDTASWRRPSFSRLRQRRRHCRRSSDGNPTRCQTTTRPRTPLRHEFEKGRERKIVRSRHCTDQ